MNFLEKLVEQAKFHRQQKTMHEAGLLSAKCIKEGANPKMQSSLIWCLILGLVMGFTDEEWEAVCKGAAEPCNRDGCTCHIECLEFMNALTKERDMAIAKKAEVEAKESKEGPESLDEILKSFEN